MHGFRKALHFWEQGMSPFMEYLKSMPDKKLCRLRDSLESKVERWEKEQNETRSSFEKEKDMLTYINEEISSRNLLLLQQIKKYVEKASALVDKGIANKSLSYVDGIDLSFALYRAADFSHDCKWNIRDLI